MNALDQKLFRDLVRLKGQVIAIALIVACGIACLVTMMSAYDSLQLSQQTYYDRYRFADVFVQLKRAPDSLTARIAEIPGVQQVQTRVVVNVNSDVPGLSEPATGRLISIPERQQPMLNDLFIRRGSYIEPGRRDQVLVSEAFATANDLEIGDEIGAVINERWQQLRIVGIALSPEYIYEINAGELFPDSQRFGIVWMNREALATAFDLKGAFNDVALSLMPGASEDEVIFRLDQLLEPYGGLGAYGRDTQVSHQLLDSEIQGLAAAAVAVPLIFLGIAAFLLNLVLARLVSTQREQIAVLKAFGYDNLAVGFHYLKLVLVITLGGAAVGTALGIWLGSLITQVYTQYFQFPVLQYRVEPTLLLTAIGVSGAAAVLGTITAVRQAVSLPPAEAMRPEPPATFRATLLERLGLQRLLSPVGQIILRNLERRIVQTGLAVLGISAAVAILVIGRYFEDATQYIVELQFRQIQREDVTLVFNQPLSSSARYDLTQLPGVLRSEPYRSVPARLRFQHRTYLSGITGLEPQGELRRILDENLQPVMLPESGVVLTASLADKIGITVGDRLTLEILEGERPTRQVPVVGVVEELIGQGAYMDIAALNALMREGQTISGAYLAVDSNYLDQLYDQLKETPAVASVALRDRLIAKFNEQITGSFAVMTSVLVVFAAVIAFGVVYNIARIALSERSRELATLQIIGFTQGEIAVILLGEQAIVTALAIPLGCAMGYGLAALISAAYDSEIFRLPLVVSPSSYVYAFVVITLTAIGSGWLIRRQLNQLDLIAVLKTRE
ncbi:FtsX-like permease family protein [Romeria aff. gracilis LEGE 07310]|uniref:FtsX-like permease family protein n=1 Tax=Vasconcelosia minhoensis LEGE 07310 TaxID=915328 RepID=A0A8J7DEA5_9CYAN|nr:FtsX-like permease family protein [Romeria gracilis]MBE9079643.1 FtsX-like permease family protein [Romeria aff. gracilis LEGE 07310]